MVDRIETSCPCLRPTPNALVIGAGESVSLTFDCDLSDEPEFQGGLAIDVEAYDDLDRVVFRTRVNVEVRSGAPPAVNESLLRHGAGRPPRSAPQRFDDARPGESSRRPSSSGGKPQRKRYASWLAARRVLGSGRVSRMSFA